MDSADLLAMQQLALQLEPANEVEHKVKLSALRYVITSYTFMGRFALAMRLDKVLLQTEVECVQKYNANRDDLVFDLLDAAKVRNKYEVDNCGDLLEIVCQVVDSAVVKPLLQRAVSAPKLKLDPVETTDEYLAVIDQVDEKVEKHKKIGICHEIWQLKKQFLAEFGIEWNSPGALNPSVRFD